MTAYKKYYHKNRSQAECIVDGLLDIESLDMYKKLLEQKKPLEGDAKITDLKPALEWPIPESCKSTTSHGPYTTFKVCDVARLSLKIVSLIGRITAMVRNEECIRVKLESIQSRDVINIFIKNASTEKEKLFQPGRVSIFSSIELRVSL